MKGFERKTNNCSKQFGRVCDTFRKSWENVNSVTITIKP